MNGTFINGKLIKKDTQVILRNKDVIAIIHNPTDLKGIPLHYQ